MTGLDTRVLIAGGGLVGCALAWHLAQMGAEVVLAERGDLNSGASGQNAGSLHFQLERRFLEHGEITAQTARIVELSAAAVAEWQGLERALDADLHVRMAGGLMVAETPAEVQLLEEKCRLERAAGIASDLIDGNAARARCPALARTVLAAAFAPDEGHADPRLVTIAFGRCATAAGADLRLGTTVRALRRADGAFEATLACGDDVRVERFARVVLASGVWAPALAAQLNLHLPLYPVALQMNVTERAPPFLAHLVQHVGKRLSMKQSHAGNVLIGGGWPALLAHRDGTFDLSVRPALVDEALAGNLRAAVTTVPRVADLALIRSWTGVTAISADELPLVGEVPRMPGCYVAAGGSAFTLGPTFARLLARAIGGAHEPLLEPVSPGRFGHLNSFMG